MVEPRSNSAVFNKFNVDVLQRTMQKGTMHHCSSFVLHSLALEIQTEYLLPDPERARHFQRAPVTRCCHFFFNFFLNWPLNQSLQQFSHSGLFLPFFCSGQTGSVSAGHHSQPAVVNLRRPSRQPNEIILSGLPTLG